MKTRVDSPRPLEPFEASAAREREKERDAPDELWAFAVTQMLVERLPRLTPPDAAPAARAQTALPERDSVPAPASDAGLDAASGEGDGKGRAETARGVPAELRAELSDERFGQLSLLVARGEAGLDIVISVADSSVKALIEADRATLVKTLKDAGLRVATVQIGGPPRAGIALAVERGGAERLRLGPGYQKPGARRTYQGSLEEGDADSEGLDLTA